MPSGSYTCEYCGAEFDVSGHLAGHIRSHKQTTRKEVVSAIQRLAAENEQGHPPTAAEMDNIGQYSSTLVISRFGSWNDGLRAAGFEPHAERAVSVDDALAAVHELAAELGRPPTSDEMDEHGRYTCATIQQKCGGWNQALQRCGYTPHVETDLSNAQLRDEVQRLAGVLGRSPTSNEMNEMGRYTYACYHLRYGSWERALADAGYKPRGIDGDANPNWRGGHEYPDYGANWDEQRERALRRDGYRCQSPGCTVTRDEHHERFGVDLNVHHIIPRRLFESATDDLDAEAANHVANLVTLCTEHHLLWERLAPLQLADFLHDA